MRPYVHTLLLLLAGCATPVMPTGGPPDQAPPVVAAATPAPGAVNVEGQRVEITFSEYVDAGSFTRALTVSPAVDGRLDVRWHRRTVVVTFPEPLRANTTYVLTIDTNLRDVNGVALRTPITLAFATGPVINRGRLSGQVVSPGQGEAVSGIDVYAYAAPDSLPPAPLPDRPDYRTQTDASGAFELTYLSEQPYYVVAVQDRNRNRRPDALEPFAVPPRAVLFADSTRASAPDTSRSTRPGSAAAPVADTTAVPQPDTTATLRPDSVRAAAPQRWIVAVLDTVPPVPQRVRVLSDRRFAVRFSEPVRFVSRDPQGWLLRDSLGAAAAVEALYQLPDDPLQVYVLTAPLPARPFTLLPTAVADTSGNPSRPDTVPLTPSVTADTMRLRFRAFVPDTAGTARLPPGQPPGVRFNQPVDSTRLYEAVAVEDTTGQPLAFTTTTPDGVTYFVETTPPRQPGQLLRIRVDGARLGGPDSLYVRTFEHLPAAEVGELSGVVAAPDTAAVVVELYPAEPRAPAEPRRVVASVGGRFVFSGLPAGSYRLRVFVDRNGNGRWDGGRIVPYEPAEPIVWVPETHRVRARWETALPAPVDFGF